MSSLASIVDISEAFHSPLLGVLVFFLTGILLIIHKRGGVKAGKALKHESKDARVDASMKRRKANFMKRNSKYGYSSSKKGFIDTWRGSEFPALGSENGLVYADHAGAALPMKSQIERGMEEAAGAVFSNPHSSGPSATLTKVLVDDAR